MDRETKKEMEKVVRVARKNERTLKIWIKQTYFQIYQYLQNGLK